MTDIKTRLADALIERLAQHGHATSRDTANDLVSAQLSLPGIAIVELPEADEDGDFQYGPYRGYLSAVDGEVIGKWGANYDGPVVPCAVCGMPMCVFDYHFDIQSL